jgi:integrase/recombinase XerD
MFGGASDDPVTRRRDFLAQMNAARRGQPPPNKGKTYPPEPLTHREVLQLLDAFGRGPTGLRDRALTVLLWRSGLRIGEALALYPKDVEPARGTVRVLHGKGDQWRLVGVDAPAMAVVVQWLGLRQRLAINGRAPLFCLIEQGRRGGAMRAAQYRDALKRAAARAGIEKRVHPHGLRHTHAFELAMEGANLLMIRRQLGHSSLAVTERYVDHLAPAQVVEIMQARSWPAAS